MLVRGVAWRKKVEWRSALCSLSGRAALSYSPRALVRPSVPGSLFFCIGAVYSLWRSENRVAQPSESIGGRHWACASGLSKFLFGKCVVHS